MTSSASSRHSDSASKTRCEEYGAAAAATRLSRRAVGTPLIIRLAIGIVPVDEARTGAISPKAIDEIAERFLASDRVEEKLELTAFSAGLADSISSVVGERRALPEPISFVRFPARPERVDPRELPRRKLTSIEGRRALLHAVAHIEFTAIHLAWDLLYRFRGLPDRFYLDWLGVAREEASHFELIRARLRELGCDYGDLPSHRGLWEVAEDTDYDVAARLALVPRCMEARGLDVTPGMISRLEQIGDSASAAVLRVILRDEVGHVALGTHWFRWVCAERRLEPDSEYLALVRRHLRGEQRGPFNRALRRQAGFSEAELSRLEEPFGG